MRCGLGQPPDEILNLPGVIKFSPSAMMEFLKSPKHYHFRYIEKVKTEKTKAMDTGNKVHMSVLEPEKFAQQYTKAPRPEDFQNLLATRDDWEKVCIELGLKVPSKLKKDEVKRLALDTKPELKERDWESILASAAQGKELISPEEFESINYLRKALDHTPKLKTIFSRPGLREQMCWIYDSELNILFRFKMDFLDDTGLVVDVKQCPCAERRRFRRKLYEEKLHVQAAMYFDFSLILHEHCKEFAFPKPRAFVFAAYEFAPPYIWQAHNVLEPVLDEGQKKYRRGLRKLLACYKANHWPPYSDKIEPLDLPHYAYSEISEDDETESQWDANSEEGLSDVTI